VSGAHIHPNLNVLFGMTWNAYGQCHGYDTTFCMRYWQHPAF
jgi:hypothetical protein